MGSYKLYQLIAFFVMKYSYKIINVQGQKADEIFLINPSHNYYPLIRLTIASIEQVTFEKDRLHELVFVLFKSFKIRQGRFLDVHVRKDEILAHEEFDSIAIDTDYYAGPDLSDIYPGIKYVVHEVSDPDLAIKDIVDELANYSKVNKEQKRKLRFNDIPIVTYVTMGICIVLFIIGLILQNGHNAVDVWIALGANYKTFTVGLMQFWRLITSGFLHSSIFHLLFNMISLFSLGTFLERKIGTKKFFIALYGSLIVSSLTSLAFSDNTVSLGISGGLYGLFAIYLVNGLYSRTLNNAGTFQVIFINLILNFMGGVDIYAHIGGFVAGIIFYYFLNNKSSIFIYLCILVVLIWRVYFTDNKYTIYGGTDMAVTDVYEDMGFGGYAESLRERLYVVWRDNQ